MLALNYFFPCSLEAEVWSVNYNSIRRHDCDHQLLYDTNIRIFSTELFTVKSRCNRIHKRFNLDDSYRDFVGLDKFIIQANF